MAIIIAPARSSADLDEAAALFRNYVAWLGIDLSFQDFDAEIADLSAKYAPLAGELLLARGADAVSLGCIGVAAFKARPGACEMKRLYVREAARGSGAGRALGFEPVPAYYHNPVSGAVFFRKAL